MPAFPIELSSAPAAPERIVGTAGTGMPVPAVESAVLPDRIQPRRTVVETIPRPAASNGIWLQFNGARWYSHGPTASFSPERFEPIGEYRGFPVYRDKANAKNEIWVTVVKDGTLAPYTRR